mgnify:FL=1
MKDFKDLSLKMLVGLFVILGIVLILIGMVKLFLYFDFSIFYSTLTILVVGCSYVIGSFIVEGFKDKDE